MNCSPSEFKDTHNMIWMEALEPILISCFKDHTFVFMQGFFSSLHCCARGRVFTKSEARVAYKDDAASQFTNSWIHGLMDYMDGSFRTNFNFLF